MFFEGPLLKRNYMHISISIENISFLRNCDIKTTKCEERHRRFYLGNVCLKIATRARLIRAVCLTLLLSFPAMDFISGQLISLTNPQNRIPVQCVNKLGKRLCDRTLLNP